MKHFWLFFSSVASSEGAGQSDGATEKLVEIFKSPILYIVLGALILLVLAFYFIKRFVKARPGAVVVVVRRGKLFKLIDEKNPKYYLIPFVDSVGATLFLGNRELLSEKLFINDGPDRLYKINYTLTYKIINPEQFFPFISSFQTLIEIRLNDELRAFADQGNSAILISEYRDHSDEILSVVNKAIGDYGVEASSFKVNFIQPLGK